MSSVIVADAGPLIALGRVGRLSLLESLYGTVLIPPCVFEELQIGSGRPGGAATGKAITSGWLKVQALEGSHDLSRLMGIVDPGEAEAMALAREVDTRFLLMDDRRGRRVARGLGLPVVGTGGVLLAAKKRGLIDAIGPVLGELSGAGYRLSADLQARLLEIAGESTAFDQPPA